MEKTREELDKYPWHRLYKVILWIGSLLLALFFSVVLNPHFPNILVTALLLSLFFFIIIFLIYRLILYIALGGKFFIDKKEKKFFFVLAGIFLLLIAVAMSIAWYQNRQAQEAAKIYNAKFHPAEVAYQNCLNKVATQTTWEPKPAGTPRDLLQLNPNIVQKNIYFDGWIAAGRPNYILGKGHWEWGFMSWMIKNHSDFCQEFDINSIRYFLAVQQVLTGINYIK